MKKKISYIWDYYKFHILTTIIVIYAVCFFTYRALNHQTADLYMAIVNVNIGSELHSELVQDDSDDTIYTYENLLLTNNVTGENLSYVQASEVKILGAITDEKLDIVLMDEEVFKSFSENAYLYDLDALWKNEPFYEELKEHMDGNMGLVLNELSPVKEAGFTSKVYLGVIANSDRLDAINRYISQTFL